MFVPLRCSKFTFRGRLRPVGVIFVMIVVVRSIKVVSGGDKEGGRACGADLVVELVRW